MTMLEHKTVTLRGSLIMHRVITADGWGTAQVETGVGELVSCTGKLLSVRVGDAVELEGSWTDHPSYGRQLKVRSCIPVTPDSAEGAVRWMASRLPDIGERRARALCEAFGDALWHVIEHEHVRLTEVEGITAARAEAVRTAYLTVAGEREYMVTLRGWGLTDGQVARCVAAWGELRSVVEHVRADPYELAAVVQGFGFLRADKVARAMGIAPDAPARIRAGIVHMLDQGASEGHCYVAGGKLRDMAARMLGVPESLIVPQIFAVVEAGRVVRRGWRVYSARLDAAEQACASALLRILHAGHTGKESA